MVKKFLTWALVVFLIDRILKFIVVETIELGKEFTFIPPLLSLTYTQNTGVAFGLLAGLGNIVVLVVTVAVLVALFILSNSKDHGSIPASLIIGGALANLYDRFVYGYVIDYLHLKSLFVFNFADLAITVGVVWLLLAQFEKDTSARKKPNAHSAAKIKRR